MPDWQWREYHQRPVQAPPQTVWQSIHSVPTDALRLTRPLMWLRTAGQDAPPRGLPMIASLPPRVIASDAPREVLLGLIFSTSRWWAEPTPPDSIAALDAMRGPGSVRVVVNMALRPAPDGGTLLSTETRASTDDDATRRRFALYWLMIRGGSGLIRRDILRAIARHAETPPAIAA